MLSHCDAYLQAVSPAFLVSYQKLSGLPSKLWVCYSFLSISDPHFLHVSQGLESFSPEGTDRK